MRGNVVLTLDLGGSGSKWGVFAGAEVQASGAAAPISGHLYSAEAREALAQGVGELRRAVGVQPASVVAGIAGLQAEFAPLVRELLAQTFQLSPSAVSVTDDLHLAYAAHFLPGEGTLIYAGTGSMAYHRSEQGKVIRAGGHGHLIDDAGGAFWQGREGLSAVLRQADEQHPETPLAAALYAALGSRAGSRAWSDIRAHVYGGGRATVARLAPAVYRAALDGDPDALRIQQQAGEELARLGRVVLDRTGSKLAAAAGGAVNPLVLAALRGSLGASAEFRPGVSSLLGGPALARQLGLLREEVPR